MHGDLTGRLRPLTVDIRVVTGYGVSSLCGLSVLSACFPQVRSDDSYCNTSNKNKP